MKRLNKVWVIVGFLAWMGSVSANVITNFATADTYIAGDPARINNNYGGLTNMIIGGHVSNGPYHGLLRFDLSGLTNVVINSVKLQMQSHGATTGYTNVTINVYELSAANANWVEGTSTGGPQAGSATWNSNGLSAWAGSAGASTAGTDYINTILASYGTATTPPSLIDFTSQAAFISAVSNKLGAALNLGLGLDGTWTASGFFRFATDESTNLTPALVIDYTVIPEPATIGLLGAGFLFIILARRRMLV